MQMKPIDYADLPEDNWVEGPPKGADRRFFSKDEEGIGFMKVQHAKWTTENEQYSCFSLGKVPDDWDPEDGLPRARVLRVDDEIRAMMAGLVSLDA